MSSVFSAGAAYFERYVTLAEGCHARGTPVDIIEKRCLSSPADTAAWGKRPWLNAARGFADDHLVGPQSIPLSRALKPHLGQPILKPRTYRAADYSRSIGRWTHKRTHTRYIRTVHARKRASRLQCATLRPFIGLIIVRGATSTDRAYAIVQVYVAICTHKCFSFQFRVKRKSRVSDRCTKWRQPPSESPRPFARQKGIPSRSVSIARSVSAAIGRRCQVRGKCARVKRASLRWSIWCVAVGFDAASLNYVEIGNFEWLRSSQESRSGEVRSVRPSFSSTIESGEAWAEGKRVSEISGRRVDRERVNSPKRIFENREKSDRFLKRIGAHKCMSLLQRKHCTAKFGYTSEYFQINL